MALVHNIDSNEKLERFLKVAMEQKNDWRDNPTFEMYTWTDYSYALAYCFKFQYRVCDPRLDDKKYENGLLQKCKNSRMYTFRLPTLVDFDEIAPRESNVFVPAELKYEVVTMRVAAFCAHCDTLDRMNEIIKRVNECRA